MCLQLFSSILLTLPRQTSGSGGKTPAVAVTELAADVLARLPANFDLETVTFGFFFLLFFVHRS